ncbi:MAG TPA: hypothetical protein VK074_04550 [Fodinibius sp.]|nr:hypothetical protein [Fodinibius sp.]
MEGLRESIWEARETDDSDAETACSHVRASRHGLQEMDEYPEAFTVQTTSHVEREMKELNKRFENGGGWSRKLTLAPPTQPI